MKLDNQPPVFPEPYELGCGTVYNFIIHHPLTFDNDGELINLKSFKEFLTSSILKPITIEEYDTGVQQSLITKVKLFGLWMNDGETEKNLAFHFRKSIVEGILKKETDKEMWMETYVVEKIESEVKITGQRNFSVEEENSIFNSIAKLMEATTPFDELDSGKEIAKFMGDSFPDLFPGFK